MGRYLAAGLLLLLAAGIFTGCRKSAAPETRPPGTAPTETKVHETVPAISTPGQTEPAPTGQFGQLMASAENLEEAQKLAELYGIRLVDFFDRVAVFHTDEDPDAVILRGERNGWPRLYRNGVSRVF